MKKFNIFLIFTFILMVSVKMILDVFNEITPEGRYENYKWYITESSEVWVKNRNNGYYDKEKAINWYEQKDLNGDAPMNQFPPFIYEEIKNALTLTFEDYSDVFDPDSIKKMISSYLDLKKEQLIENIISSN